MEDFFTEADRAELLLECPGVKLSTVGEYAEALASQASNAAGAHIDAGDEPYLMSREAASAGMEYFIPVHDIGQCRYDDGSISLYLPHSTVRVAPETLLAWR